MKNTILFTICLILSQLAFSQSMKDFKWLEGTWKRYNVKPGKTAFEVWEKSKVGYEGMGVSMTGVDTTFVEELSIIEEDSDLYYVANVSSNGKPTYFKITSFTNAGFISENPEHDFPKKIEYKLEGERLTAIISAGEKSMGFVFEKQD